MKLQRLATIILFIAIKVTFVNAQWKHIGKEFSLEVTTPICDLIENIEKYFNKDVKIEGVIASACTNEGFFIEVVPKDGKGEGIVVNFPELIHKFPTDCAGSQVIVEGMFYQKIYPKSRVSHWQGHSFRKGKKVPEFSLIKRMTAKAVSIHQTKGIVPKPDEIKSVSVDKIDLGKMEFETDGFGCGKKILAPGDSVEEHNSGNYREIIHCLEGKLTVIKQGFEPIVLNPGEICYIPPNTKHMLKNNLDKPVIYFFTFSKKIETEEKKHEH